MEKLLEWLRQKGHSLPTSQDARKKVQGYYGMPISPERIVGITMHSIVSGRPRSNFYTDGQKIYFHDAYPAPYELTPGKEEDTIREGEILRLLGARKRSIQETFAEEDGHLRIRNFDGLFSYNASRPITGFYKYKELPGGLIIKDEKKKMKKRIQRNLRLIQELLEVLKSEEPPMPDYGKKLEDSLREFGYSPEQRAE